MQNPWHTCGRVLLRLLPAELQVASRVSESPTFALCTRVYSGTSDNAGHSEDKLSAERRL